MVQRHFHVEAENRGVVASLACVLVLGLMLPVLASMASRYIPHPASFSGVPVEETIFADIVNEQPDPAMLPQGVINITEDTVEIRADFSSFISVNLTEAVGIAHTFLSEMPYLSGRTFEFDANGSGFYHGMWTLGFTGPELTVGIDVNAISGRVLGFRSHWVAYSPNPFDKDANETHPLSTDVANDKALQFLRGMNYTLSPFCRVLGPVLETSVTYLSYSALVLSFYNVMNDTYVEDNLVSLQLDIETGEVLEFGYYWTYIPCVPVDHLISAQAAERIALADINPIGDYPATIEITSSVLVLENHGEALATSSFYRLEWVVSGTYTIKVGQPTVYSYSFTVEIHPVSGVIWFWHPQYFTSGAPIVADGGVPIMYGIWAISLSFVAAAVSFTFARTFARRMPAIAGD